MKRFLFAIMTALLFVVAAYAEQSTFEHVKIRRHKSPQDRTLVDKSGTLVVEESARKLTVRGDDKVLEVPFDNVNKIVFDVSTHMRGGALSQVVGGLAGAAIRK